MGLKSYIDERQQVKFNKRMDSYLKGGGTMEYNPFLLNSKSILTNDRFTLRLAENSVWYAGIDYDLQLFYQRNINKMRNEGQISDAINYFWERQDRQLRKIHSGVPQLICEKMVDLITGNGYSIMIDEETEESKDNERLKEILKDNKFATILNHGIETESWAHGAPFRITKNLAVSEYPIIEVVEPEHYSYRSESGRIVEDIFTTYPEDGNGKYRLKAMYGVEDEEGVPVSYIKYKLERVSEEKNKKTWIEVSLETLQSTAKLTPMRVAGYDKKFSLYKPNKTPNSEFRGSLLGESDYAGSIGAFDAVDEIISTWIQEFRDGKLNKYFPSDLLPRNSRGEDIINQMQVHHIMYEGNIGENADSKIQYSQGDVRTDKHIESYKSWMMTILNNAGLSPLTVGMTGLEAMNAGEQSQKEREKVSIRTRNKKIELWVEFLNDFIERVLVFDDVIENLDIETGSTSFGEYKINTVFEDYILKSQADRTKEASEGVAGLTWDIETAVDYIHETKTKTEKLAIVANIKLQNGIDLTPAEASALQENIRLSNEMLTDEGVELIVTGQENEDNVVIEENENTLLEEDQEEE